MLSPPNKGNPYHEFYRRAVWEAERNKWTSLFDAQILRAKLQLPIAEYRFSESRLWRFDRAWPEHHLAVEIEGGLWMKGKGAHSHPSNIMRDIEKYNAAVLLGWRVLRFTDVHLKSNYAMESVKNALII